MEYSSQILDGKIIREVTQGIGPSDLFDWCSISKIITAILVCDNVDSQGANLNQSIRFGGQDFKLKNLLTHCSGLPKIPSNLTDYSTYTKADAEAYIAKLDLTNQQWVYSNLGYALLGDSLNAQGIGPEDFFTNKSLYQGPRLSSLKFDSKNLNEERFWKKDPFWWGSACLKSTLSDFEFFLTHFLFAPHGHFPRFLEFCEREDLIIEIDGVFFGPGFCFEKLDGDRIFQLQGGNHFFQNNVFFNERKGAAVHVTDRREP